jgi:transcriptional regulator with XRE-family HTH domain
MSTPRELGALLRSRRREQGESQGEVAAALGVTRQWLARVEAGTGNPDLRQLFALCDHLGLQLTALPSAPSVATEPPVATTGLKTERADGPPPPLACPSAKPVHAADPDPVPRSRRPAETPSAGTAERPTVPARLRAAKATAPHTDLDQLLGSYRTGTSSRSRATRPPGERESKPGHG